MERDSVEDQERPWVTHWSNMLSEDLQNIEMTWDTYGDSHCGGIVLPNVLAHVEGLRYKEN